jgi:hypothetical protein
MRKALLNTTRESEMEISADPLGGGNHRALTAGQARLLDNADAVMDD